MPHFLDQAIILIEDLLPILGSNRAVISMVRVVAMSAAKVARVGDVELNGKRAGRANPG
jgi:hypothetical protein